MRPGPGPINLCYKKRRPGYEKKVLKNCQPDQQAAFIKINCTHLWQAPDEIHPAMRRIKQAVETA
jgi:hypothetical protein